VIFGGVRAGVPRPEQTTQRLAGLIEVGLQRVKLSPPVSFAAAFSFSECAVIRVASTSIVNRTGAPSSSQNRARARACIPRSNPFLTALVEKLYHHLGNLQRLAV
jgi:hypothetical protein